MNLFFIIEYGRKDFLSLNIFLLAVKSLQCFQKLLWLGNGRNTVRSFYEISQITYKILTKTIVLILFFAIGQWSSLTTSYWKRKMYVLHCTLYLKEFAGLWLLFWKYSQGQIRQGLWSVICEGILEIKKENFTEAGK